MNSFNRDKQILKQLRSDLVNKTPNLSHEFKDEVVETLNTLIGRINCYLTDDDGELEHLNKQDKLGSDV